MLVGNINFVYVEELSDAYENAFTLMSHTVEWCNDKKIIPSTLARQYANGEEFDLTVEEIEKGVRYYNIKDVYKVAELLYADMLEKRQLTNFVIVPYEVLLNIEIAVKKNS